jgi:hypothetical protein
VLDDCSRDVLGRYPGVPGFWSNPCVKNPGVGRWRLVASLVAVTALVAACGGHKTASQPPSATGVPASPTLSVPSLSAPALSATPSLGSTAAVPASAALKTYGYGANPTGADYQPGVVVVGGGPASIRSASGNGLTWTIAKSAPNADKLVVGSVMVLTSVATGRVAAIHDDADTRVVTLAPVDLTDVIKNGSIDVDQALPASAISYQLIPDLAWAQQTPQAGDLPSANISSSAYHGTKPFTAETAALPQAAAGGGTMPPASESSLEVKVGAWTVSPNIGDDKLELGVERDGALKVGIDFAFDTNNLKFHGIDTIKNGQTQHSGFSITGITGLTISLQAGAAGGSADNEKIKIEAPIEANLEIPPSPATAGLPLDLKVVFTFSVETAITGNNSTLVATGIWGLEGPIGYDGENFQTPKFTVKQSIIDSITGITLGPSGIVFGVEMKFQVGVGVASLSAGPFAGVTVDLGITNGSSLGASLVRCKGATLDLRGSAGVGVELSAAEIPILKDILPGIKYEYSLGTSTSLLHRSQVVPDVPLCNA